MGATTRLLSVRPDPSHRRRDMWLGVVLLLGLIALMAALSWLGVALPSIDQLALPTGAWPVPAP
jgi:hypothetical protein